jgi:hypothetical protein
VSNGGPQRLVPAKLPFRVSTELTKRAEHYAVKELNYFVARMVQTFEMMKSQDASEWTEQYALLMTCKNGVRVSLTRVRDGA